MIMLISLLAAYGMWLLANRKASGARAALVADLAFAAAFAVAHFTLYPASVIYDDGGIILKYMDNFAAGHFYCYNIEDGPVYGISGFIHGVFAGALAWLHLLSPDHALLASNLAGLFLLGFLLLRILRTLIPNAALVFSCWIVSLLLSRYLLITAKQGLETPLHLALVLAGFLFLLRDQPRRFWFSCALMVISKLDALPVAALLAVAFLLHHRSQWFPLSLRNPMWRNALAWAGLPALAWVGFATVTFGSVMPQSARAKLLFAQHAKDSWFPFIMPLFQGPFALFTAGLLAVLALHAGVRLWQRRPLLILRECLFGLAALSFLSLYYFYNPREQMPWYYTLPDLFLVTQALLSLHLVLARHLRRLAPVAAAGLLAAYAVVLWPQMSARIRAHGGQFDVIEHERILVGRWIHGQSRPGDKVLCGYGHIARNCRRYVLDCSGLNSKAVIELRLDTPGLIRRFRPEWVVLQELMPPGLAAGESYRLAASFFNVASAWASSASRGETKMHAWRVYRRTADHQGLGDLAMEPGRFRTSGRVETNGSTIVVGSAITADFDDQPVTAEAAVLGFAHADAALPVTIRILGPGQEELARHAITLPPRDARDFERGYTTAVTIPLPPARAVARIEVAGGDPEGQAVTLLDPAWSGTPVRIE